jgi:hypothetical protein
VSSDELYNSAVVAGAAIIGIGGVVGALVQIRAWIREPFERLEAAIHSTKADVQATKADLSALQVHFDPNGGNLRGRITLIEQRLAALEVNGSAERAELRGLILDLRPIIAELRDRP